MLNHDCPKCGGPMKDCSHLYEGRFIESKSCLYCGQDDYPRRKGVGVILSKKEGHVARKPIKKSCEICKKTIIDRSPGYHRRFCPRCKSQRLLKYAANYRERKRGEKHAG